jgi:hypothetical protein
MGKDPVFAFASPSLTRPLINGCPILRVFAKGGMKNIPGPAVAVALAVAVAVAVAVALAVAVAVAVVLHAVILNAVKDPRIRLCLTLIRPSPNQRVPHPSRLCEGWDEKYPRASCYRCNCRCLCRCFCRCPFYAVILSAAKDPCISSLHFPPIPASSRTASPTEAILNIS